MKAQTKALVASVIVVAIALSALSGVTYSWFSDSESSKNIDVSTATVDIDNVTILLDGVVQEGDRVVIGDIRPGMSQKIEIKSVNKSTTDAIYRVYGVYTNSTGESAMTPYDELNMQLVSSGSTTVGTLNATGLADGDVLKADESARIVMSTEWSPLPARADIDTAVILSVPESYGGSVSDPVRYYTGSGVPTTSDDPDRNPWSPDTQRSFTLRFVVQAIQADYTPAVSTADSGAAFKANQNAVSYTTGETSLSDGDIQSVKVTGISTGSSLEGSVLTVSETADAGVALSVNGTSVSLKLTDADGSPVSAVSANVSVKVKGIITDPYVMYNPVGGVPEDLRVTGFYYTMIGEDYYTVISFSTTHFSTFVVGGGDRTIKLEEDLVLDHTWIFTGSAILDLNGKTVSNTSDIWNPSTGEWSLISVRGGTLTITGEGKLLAKENDCYAVDIQDGAACIIENGEFRGNISAVYVYEGSLIIKGGVFSIKQTAEYSTDQYRFTINLYDAHRKDGTASASITGGKFYMFDPANNLAEGPNTNFVPKGYTSTPSAEYYEVIGTIEI